MHELSEQPKTIPPDELPFHLVLSAPLVFGLDTGPEVHRVVANLSHGALKDASYRETIKTEYSAAYPRGEHPSNIVQPYALRAPEVILGLGWDPAIDIWSLGCMVSACLLDCPLRFF